MSEPIILPPEPEGPVWDRNGDKWERTGEMLHVHGREWAEWRHVASGNVGTWPAPLMRGPVTSAPPWKPEVGGVCETEEQYAAMPEGSIVARANDAPFIKRGDGLWRTETSGPWTDKNMAALPSPVLRVGWSL